MPTVDVYLSASLWGIPTKSTGACLTSTEAERSCVPAPLLTREWDGHLQRVMVLAEGFAWNGKTYPSLSKVAFAITGSRWNGPRFFGLRDKAISEVRS
jgi:hypothetical protein